MITNGDIVFLYDALKEVLLSFNDSPDEDLEDLVTECMILLNTEMDSWSEGEDDDVEDVDL